MRKSSLWTLTSVLAGILIAGCGYTTKSTLPAHLRSIYIEPFVNQVDYANQNRRDLYLPLLEVDVRNAIIDRFLFNGYLRIAKKETADLILKGELVNFDRGELRETDDEVVEEYRIYVTVNIALWDTKKQAYMWQINNFVGEAEYFVTGPNAKSEQAALDDALKDLARRVVEQTLEYW